MSSSDPRRDKLIVPVAVVTMVAWFAALVVALLGNQVAPLTITTPVMLLLAGYVFGTSIVRSATRGSGDS